MAIVKGIIKKSVKVVIYGPEGIGKSTFASKFPAPVFIDTEGSTKYLDVARFDKTSTWDDIFMQVNEAVNDGSFKTIVIDTADWCEMLCIKAVCKSHNVNGIEDIGYGKGYVYVQEEFKKLLDGLEDCVNKGFNVVLTAHAQMRKFEQPDEMGAYDRWEMKLSKKVAPMVKEWADMLLFANYQTIVVEDSKTKSKKAAGGQRVMYTQHHPCWDAKNRVGMPDKMDFSYDLIKKYIETGIEKPKTEKPKTEKKPEPAPVINPIIEGAPEVLPYDPPRKTAYDELKELLIQANISDAEVEAACVSKNFQPADKKLKDYPEGMIRDVLIAKFDGFRKFIIKEREKLKAEVPFA